jgi:hypothetical protein
MANNYVSLAMDKDDHGTRNLARTVLIAELGVTIMSALVVVDYLNSGSFAYTAKWHFERWKARYKAELKKRRTYRVAVGEVLLQAENALAKES